MPAADITTQAVIQKPSPAEDLSWPFFYEISALNALANLYAGSPADTTTITASPPSAQIDPGSDLSYPFFFSQNAANWYLRALQGDDSASAAAPPELASWFEDLAYPFRFTIDALNYIVAKTDGRADPNTITVLAPNDPASVFEDVVWPFKFSAAALNAICGALGAVGSPTVDTLRAPALEGFQVDLMFPMASDLQSWNAAAFTTDAQAGSGATHITAEDGGVLLTEDGDKLVIENEF